MLKMIVKKHIAPDKRLVLAVCDKELLGRVLEDDQMRLDLGSEFYKGEEIDKKGLRALMKKAHMLNLVGENSVKCGIECGLVKDKNIIMINRVPHAQTLVIGE